MRVGIARHRNQNVLAAAFGDSAVDLSGCGPWENVIALIIDWQSAQSVLHRALDQRASMIPAPVQWLAPIPDPPKFFLLAGNFRPHVVESGFSPLPENNMTPQFFLKPSTTIVGDSDPISLTPRNTALDYEGELAVVIGKSVKHATSAEAKQAIWGYTIVNDISERRLNATMSPRNTRANDEFFDWLAGKWFDNSTPMGPYIVTADEIAKPEELIVRTFLNTEKVQEARLSTMVHDSAEAMSYISSIVTLQPGDVISMGTPAGVGMAHNRFLKHGDVIECEVSQIGRLTNRVQAK